MTTYRVTNTIQNRAGTEAPVEVAWYRGTSLAAAMSAMTQGAIHDQTEDEHTSSLPESMRFRVLSVHLDIIHPACSHCGTVLIGEDCPKYGDGPTHA